MSTGTPFIFSTTGATARMAAADRPPRIARSSIAEEVGDRPSIAQRRLHVLEAIKIGRGDRIAVAYLELARALIDEHQLAGAQLELEEGVELLMTPDGRGPVWRLLLSLAALYERHGDHVKARVAARAARDQAARDGSAVGRERGERLCARLR